MKQERIVLVTGGLGDIGKAIAQKFAQAGYFVIIHDLAEPERAEQEIAQWQIPLGQWLYGCVDSRERGQIQEAFDLMEERNHLPSTVIVNAGVVAPVSFLEMAPEQWSFHLDVNLTGAFHVAQETSQRWIAKGVGGTLLFTSTWVQDVPQSGISAYCVSKSGLKMLAKAMALELGTYGIRVNLVAPGIVDAGLSARLFREGRADPNAFTPHIPLGTLQTSEEVADVFWLLAQPEASYITGATLVADGGMSLFQFQPPHRKERP